MGRYHNLPEDVKRWLRSPSPFHASQYDLLLKVPDDHRTFEEVGIMPGGALSIIRPTT